MKNLRKNRERLLGTDAPGDSFWAVAQQAKAAGLMSPDHFTVEK